MANGNGEKAARPKGPAQLKTPMTPPKGSGAILPSANPAKGPGKTKAPAEGSPTKSESKGASTKSRAKPRPRADKAEKSATDEPGAAVNRATSPKEAEAQAVGYSKRADQYLDDPKKADRLLKDAQSKAKKNKGPLSESFDEIMTLVRLVRAYVKGEYKDVPWESIALAIGALLYFVSPIDLIPDFVPIAGYVDDAAVGGFVIKSISNDLREFRDWEGERSADE